MKCGFVQIATKPESAAFGAKADTQTTSPCLLRRGFGALEVRDFFTHLVAARLQDSNVLLGTLECRLKRGDLGFLLVAIRCRRLRVPFDLCLQCGEPLLQLSAREL